jgi:glucosamine 6-phosphate synthetase-like amidotransferase/phosphosugar isomerase protein
MHTKGNATSATQNPIGRSMNRETREELELEKLSVEIRKFMAETRKLNAEEEKMKREAMFYPFAVGASLVAALVALFSFLTK